MTEKKETITLRETVAVHVRAWREIRGYCPGLYPCTALHSALQALTPYASIYLSAQLLNELAGPRRPQLLWRWALLLIFLTAGLNLLTQAAFRWQTALQDRYQVRRQRLYGDKLRSMDFADIDKAGTHDLLSQIRQNEGWADWGIHQLYLQFSQMTEGMFGIAGSVALTASLFYSKVPQTAGAFVVLNHPLCLGALFGFLALLTVLAPLFRNHASAYWSRYAEQARFGNRVFHAFSFIFGEQRRSADFRMYNQQVIARHYMADNTFSVGGQMHRAAKGPMGAWEAAAGALGSVLTGAVYLFVCLKAWAGAFGIGSVTQYVGAVSALSRNISLVIETVGTLRSNVPFLRTAFEFLDIPNAMYQGSLTTEKRADRKYTVEFRDVSFCYPGSERYALRHVNMKFRIGSRIAVVGENGSGKTTFIKLLCRLYDPSEGEILLNGIDIRKYDYDDYRKLFSVVFQDFQLLSQPLGSNVAGAAVYDRERAEKALVDAGFGERLASWPKGLDTMLYQEFGEDGVNVSGGEAQKIAIARALYRDAPFIILDEPTAALDPVAEAEIYSRFNEIVTDRTAVYISHRLSSCRFCDEILVFDHGSVIQQGSHSQLLAKEQGKYAQLWNVQAQYYTETE